MNLLKSLHLLMIKNRRSDEKDNCFFVEISQVESLLWISLMLLVVLRSINDIAYLGCVARSAFRNTNTTAYLNRSIILNSHSGKAADIRQRNLPQYFTTVNNLVWLMPSTYYPLTPYLNSLLSCVLGIDFFTLCTSHVPAFISINFIYGVSKSSICWVLRGDRGKLRKFSKDKIAEGKKKERRRRTLPSFMWHECCLRICVHRIYKYLRYFCSKLRQLWILKKCRIFMLRLEWVWRSLILP